MSYDVFLSARGPDAWVDTLAGNLDRHGLRVFLQRWELAAGAPRVGSVEDAMRQASGGVVVATPDAVEDGWWSQEYEALFQRSQENGDFVLVPVLLGMESTGRLFLDRLTFVDFGDPARPDERHYRRAFHELVRGLEKRGPGAGTYEGALDLPKPERTASGGVVADEKTFLDDVFRTIASHRILMLLAQADRDKSVLIDAVLERARHRYGAERTFHVKPPYSRSAQRAEYFAYLGRQCGFDGVDGPVAWEAALEDNLGQGEVFLLVSRFENGSAESRDDLAGALRSLAEGGRLRVVLCGGEGLAEQKFVNPQTSLLSAAEPLFWPELTVDDVLARQSRDFPGEDLDDATAQAFLDASGGHPRLVRHLLQQRPASSDAVETLRSYGYVRQLFQPYREDGEQASRIREWLDADDAGEYDDWPADALQRRLFWANVFVKRRGRFRWRCDVLKDAARKALGA